MACIERATPAAGYAGQADEHQCQTGLLCSPLDRSSVKQPVPNTLRFSHPVFPDLKYNAPIVRKPRASLG